MIATLMVANRGEIARRVFATCRRLGITTVAVHSDADAGLPYVAEADIAVRLPGNTPAETYLDIDLLLQAAQRTGADAIHPGYGFLSESAAFAQAVVDAGLTWVGPSPDSITVMGAKIEAKQIISQAGVPVLEAPTEPTATDFPLLVKASAGGGGRGMRIVRDLASLEGEVAAARDEAASAFGDGTVFIEPYVEASRHVEVQIVGYPDGVLVLGERDCSVQRRHQKVVEESPAPHLSQATREALHAAAKAAGEAIDYRGAGTVEFLYDPTRPDTESFFFLEMNTRLQVEHPVTECVYGVDLVELQLAVAEGARTPPVAGAPQGHAIEVRLYAEEPAAAYAPQSGQLATLEVPHEEAFSALDRAGIRLDAGFEAGDEVSIHYDAMLAKVISWAPTRDQAIRQLTGALRRAAIHGLQTNRDQLLDILRHDAFLAGGVGTDFLSAEQVGTQESMPGDETWQALASFAAAIAVTEAAAAASPVQRGVTVGWRNVVSAPQTTVFTHGDNEVPVSWHGSVAGRNGYLLVDPTGAAEGARCRGAQPEGQAWRVRIALESIEHTFTVSVRPTAVDVDGAAGHVALGRVPRFTDPAQHRATGSLLAPMPGTVVRVLVQEGERVEEGQTVLVLEAMKMQHQVTAPQAGIVTEASVAQGSQVAAGEVLAVVSASDQEEGN